MNEGLTIQCFYSCPECGLVKVAVEVQARGDEDVVEWLEGVAIVAMGADHRRRSPACRPGGLRDIMIPVTGAEKIGGPSVS